LELLNADRISVLKKPFRRRDLMVLLQEIADDPDDDRSPDIYGNAQMSLTIPD